VTSRAYEAARAGVRECLLVSGSPSTRTPLPAFAAGSVAAGESARLHLSIRHNATLTASSTATMDSQPKAATTYTADADIRPVTAATTSRSQISLSLSLLRESVESLG
jgi:hypothetical protein